MPTCVFENEAKSMVQSGDQATTLTFTDLESSWHESVHRRTHFAGSTFATQMCTKLSRPPVANKLPSLDQATDETAAVCSLKVAITLQDSEPSEQGSTSQILTVVSVLPITNKLSVDPGDQAIELIEWDLPRSFATTSHGSSRVSAIVSVLAGCLLLPVSSSPTSPNGEGVALSPWFPWVCSSSTSASDASGAPPSIALSASTSSCFEVAPRRPCLLLPVMLASSLAENSFALTRLHPPIELLPSPLLVDLDSKAPAGGTTASARAAPALLSPTVPSMPSSAVSSSASSSASSSSTFWSDSSAAEAN
mmetsp:Transcript_47496/g.103903  ORF Transcript_47496/g.103903 Transcript_47496/m.103903 type:complete len:307 (+) Transcript_47496:129-1049(+)